MDILISQKTMSAVTRQRGLFPPLMATLMADRKTAITLSSMGVLIVLLQISGLPGWLCPLDTALGRPCPGCGLTRALAQLSGGHWQLALQTHVLAPLAATAIFLVGIAAVLPRTWHRRLVSKIALIEGRSGLGVAVIVAIIGHWIGRQGGLW